MVRNTGRVRDPRIDIVDETFIRAAPQVVRDSLDDQAWTDQIWPHLSRAVTRDRGVKGVRWSVTGQVVGEMEVWLEPFRDGVVVHHYVRGTRALLRALARSDHDFLQHGRLLRLGLTPSQSRRNG